MAVNSSSGGLTPASDSLVALTKIMSRIIDVSIFAELAEPGIRSPGRALDRHNEWRRPESTSRKHFFWRFGRLALVAQALGEGGFERGNAFVQALVLLARLLRHRLDRVELLALHDIEAIENALHLGAHDASD